MSATSIKPPIEEVFSVWSAAMESAVGSNLSMDTSKIPSTFPYARMSYLGGVHSGGDLDNSECAITITFQIECFATGQKALSDVYDIDYVSHQSMVGMGFRRTTQNAVENASDNSIKRLVSRYSRIYCEGEI